MIKKLIFSKCEISLIGGFILEVIEKISNFAGKTFTLWVLIFAVIAYLFPGNLYGWEAILFLY